MLQSELGSWGTPPPRQVLIEAAKYIDLPIMATTPPWVCLFCTDGQSRIDFTAKYLGDRPWINWIGFYASPDSAESGPSNGAPAFLTQAQRGAAYQTMVKMMVDTNTTAYGSHPVVGFDWWDLYDENGERANWGLLTPLDNPYDGKAATIAGCGKDQWGRLTGGEKSNYGNFIGAVGKANRELYSSLVH
jgi:hypothetical protein